MTAVDDVVSVGYAVGHHARAGGSVGLPTDRVVGALADLADRAATSTGRTVELVLLATCNRTELYTVGAGAELAGQLFELLFTHCPAHELPAVPPTTRQGVAAAEHLFAVAAGLESAVLGEREVLGQIRRAVRVADDCGTLGRIARGLFDSAIRTGRDVRVATAIDAGAVGLGAVVAGIVEEAARMDAAQDTRSRIVLVGAGATGWSVARELATRDLAPALVVNRTLTQAADLARQVGAAHMALDATALSQVLRPDDVLVTAVAGGALIDWAQLPPLRAVVDLGRPASVTGAPTGAVIDLDEVERRRSVGVRARGRAVPGARAMVRAAGGRWAAQVAGLAADEEISRLMTHLDELARSRAHRDEARYSTLRRAMRRAVHPYLLAIRERTDGAVEQGRTAALVALEGTS